MRKDENRLLRESTLVKTWNNTNYAYSSLKVCLCALACVDFKDDVRNKKHFIAKKKENSVRALFSSPPLRQNKGRKNM